MKKIWLYLLIIFCITMFVPIAESAAINDDVAKIETELFDTTYPKNNINVRLSRIEKNIYGQDFPKLSAETRLLKIKADTGFASVEPKVSQNKVQGNQNVVKQSSATQRATKEDGEAEYPAVDQLEATIYKTVYKNENIYKRLERLEYKVFGATNQTSTLSDRVFALRKVVKMPEDKLAKANSQNYSNFQSTVMSNQPQKNQLGRYSSNRNYDFEVGVLEQQVFGREYAGQNISQRLSRLENQLLKRDYSSDDEASRIERLGTVIVAQGTAKNYDCNKFKQFLSTGLQLSTVVLMILAIIL